MPTAMIQHLKVYAYLHEPNLKRWIWDPSGQGERQTVIPQCNWGEHEVLAAVILKIIKWIKTNVRDRPTDSDCDWPIQRESHRQPIDRLIVKKNCCTLVFCASHNIMYVPTCVFVFLVLPSLLTCAWCEWLDLRNFCMHRETNKRKQKSVVKTLLIIND